MNPKGLATPCIVLFNVHLIVMRITAVREIAVNLQGNVANSVVDFSHHTVSLVAIISDQFRAGKPVIGLAFNSIGRFAQSGILHERMFPRLLAKPPEQLLNADQTTLDPAQVATALMRDEKPGGHGDRAGAAAALELAVWDLNAKLHDVPAYVQIADSVGQPPNQNGAPVYAAGGYYYPNDSQARLKEEIQTYQTLGYDSFKIKIGGVSLNEDMQRLQAVIDLAGAAEKVAVDANGRFDLRTAQAYAAALSEHNLRWYEEPGDPLDYALTADLTQDYGGAIATGENLFSLQDSQNLMRYAGLRPEKDVLQMDPGLSYGLTEYLRIIKLVQSYGFQPAQMIPHGGHLINLHIVTALGLGGCEAYPGVFQPFGGYAPQCTVADGRVKPSDAPGFGLEQKPELAPYIKQLTES